MIFCNLDPSLFTMEGFLPNQVDEVRELIKSLAIHKQNILINRAKIPVTNDYLEQIMASLDSGSPINPALDRPFKENIYTLLGQVTTPPLAGGVADGQITPDIISSRVKEEMKRLWVDCLTAAFFQKVTEIGQERAQAETVIATQASASRIGMVSLISDELCQLLEIDKIIWSLPLLSNDVEWNGHQCNFREWPEGLDAALVEYFGYAELGIACDAVQNHRRIQFEPSCRRDISRESDPSLRKSIIEVIACRAYNQVRPEHNDEPVKGHPGLRHVYVKKMTPPARLHYYFDGESVVYSLYSCGDHDKGL